MEFSDEPSLKDMETALEMRPAVKQNCIEDLEGPEDYLAFIKHLYVELVVPGYWVPGDLTATYANASHLFSYSTSEDEDDEDDD